MKSLYDIIDIMKSYMKSWYDILGIHCYTGGPARLPGALPVPGVAMAMAPRDLLDDEDDGDHGQPDPHDDADLGFDDAGPPAGAALETKIEIPWNSLNTPKPI